jgi:hypothetical protein
LNIRLNSHEKATALIHMTKILRSNVLKCTILTSALNQEVGLVIPHMEAPDHSALRPLESRPSRQTIAKLTLAGFVSAVITILVQALIGISLLQGFIFGVAIAFCLFRLKLISSIKKQAAFVVICGAAFPVSIWMAITHSSWFPVFSSAWNGQGNPPKNAFFAGGVTGGAIVLAAFLLIVVKVKSYSTPALILAAGSFASGLLGVTGWMWNQWMDTNLNRALNAIHMAPKGIQHQPEFASIYLTWQTGMSLLLGIVWWYVKRMEPTDSHIEDTPPRGIRTDTSSISKAQRMPKDSVDEPV